MKDLGVIQAFAMSGGDWVIYLLLAASVVAVGMIIERAVVLSRHTLGDWPRGDFAARWKQGDLAGARAFLRNRPLALGVLAAVAEGGSAREREEALRHCLVLERRRLERRLILLNTLGNNAPFVGLLGTVLGVVRAFHDLAFAGGAGPEVVMQGLSEALVATAVGILVALPCVGAYNVFQKLINDRIADAESFGRRLAALS